jgi:hypothetical protein
MAEESTVVPQTEKKPSLFQNWISLAGIIVATSSFFAVLCLIALDYFTGSKNPYIGILTYIVTPAFLSTGLLLIVTGALLERRHRHHLAPGEVPRNLRIDFNLPHHRRTFLITSVIAVIFMLMSAFGSYQTFHFTESVTFCGKTCHKVMKPEYTAYQNSAHARVACVQCHIGPGVGWFVKSKLSGSYQVYSVLAKKFPTPIPTPIKNLRPAQETCEECHWPQKFFAAKTRVNHHFLADETNTPWNVTLLMKVGGGDPGQGPVAGIHWHVSSGQHVEYIATDEARQKIPWVRVTDREGKVTIYQAKEGALKPEQVTAAVPRRMDCIDCHNRPAHIYNAPTYSVNTAMAAGRISPTLPSIKKNAIEALMAPYKTEPEALAAIATKLAAQYKSFPEQPRVQQAIAAVQEIYSNNFFPEMKADWRKYPTNLGHTVFPGCYRCHDGKHATSEGKAIRHDCNLCHTIISQGAGAKAGTIQPQGMEFEHPADIGDLWKDSNCTDCHNGGIAGQ